MQILRNFRWRKSGSCWPSSIAWHCCFDFFSWDIRKAICKFNCLCMSGRNGCPHVSLIWCHSTCNCAQTVALDTRTCSYEILTAVTWCWCWDDHMLGRLLNCWLDSVSSSSLHKHWSIVSAKSWCMEDSIALPLLFVPVKLQLHSTISFRTGKKWRPSHMHAN